MCHVGSKTKSQGQILEKPCVRSRGHIFNSIIMKLGQNVVVVAQKTLTFCNISVITEEFYLKLGVCVHYRKSNPYYQERQFNFFFFFQNYAAFSN